MTAMMSETSAEVQRRSAFWIGCGLVLLAGLVLSLGVFAIRSATASDAMQYLFWRAIGFTLAMALTAWFRDRRSPLAQVMGMGRYAWLACVAMTASQITFISSVKISTFAETFFLCSLAPLIVAVVAGPLLSERMGWIGGVAIAIGLAGVAAMTGGGGLDPAMVASGQSAAASSIGGSGLSLGAVLAVVSAFAFASYTLATRGSRAADRDATLIMVGVMTVAATGLMLVYRGMPLMANPTDAAIAALHGAFILSLGLFLFGQGSRTIPAVTFTMLAQAEAVVAPVWGYLYFAENPGAGVVAGGALILTAVVLQSIDGARSAARSRRSP